jgi:hypothetical protein
MKRITAFLCIVGFAVILLSSCQKVNDNSNAQLIVKATTTSGLKSASTLTGTDVSLSSTGSDSVILDTFLINIKDIEFELDESSSGTCDDCSDDCGEECGEDCSDDCDSTYKDIKAEGPYLINVISPEVLDGLVIDNFSIPNAVYDEIEFDLAPYKLTDNSKMTGRSIYVAGTINGKRFELWTSKEKEIEIEFHDQSAVNLTGETIKFYIDISVDKIKTNLEAMNLGTAVDGNNNGIIEIGYNDPDGNSALAHSILNAITGCFELDDEDHHDDNNHGDHDK